MHLTRWRLAVFFAGAIGSGALAACRSPDAPASVRTPADTSVGIVLPAPTLEPAESMTAGVELVYAGTHHAAPSQQVVWTSSDRTIATVDAGVIVGRRPGTVTITAQVGGRSASQDVKVE